MDAAIYTRLLREHRDRVYSRALFVLRDAEDAEDVTQEAFLRLWRGGDAVSPERVGGWLQRVVHNLCIDQARRRKVVRTHLGRPDPDGVAELVARGPEGAPDGAVQLDERQRRILDAMATLTPETRSVMLMHYYQGMKLQEIADSLGKTVSALKVQIHRARRSLRHVLEAEDDWTRAAGRETG
jgi:RNA polymerase sigma-70 factor (ECF subfamily)